MAESVKIDMNLGSGRTVQINVSKAIKDYFNITASAATTSQATLRKRKAHTRRVFNRDTLDVTVKSQAGVRDAEWYDTKNQRGRRGSGKLIKIPTELPYNAAAPSSGFRLVSTRVPATATNYVIANWINTKFTAHKPSYFLTPSGVKYPVNVPAQADPNPGNTGGTTTTTTTAPAA